MLVSCFPGNQGNYLLHVPVQNLKLWIFIAIIPRGWGSSPSTAFKLTINSIKVDHQQHTFFFFGGGEICSAWGWLTFRHRGLYKNSYIFWFLASLMLTRQKFWIVINVMLFKYYPWNPRLFSNNHQLLLSRCFRKKNMLYM